MCDAVQAETYEIDEVDVSNFVLPLYFTGGDELGGRNDFLSRAAQRQNAKIVWHESGRLHRLLQSGNRRLRALRNEGRQESARTPEV